MYETITFWLKLISKNMNRNHIEIKKEITDVTGKEKEEKIKKLKT